MKLEFEIRIWHTLWLDSCLHLIPSVPLTITSCVAGALKMSFESFCACAVLRKELLLSPSSLRFRWHTGNTSMPKCGAKCSRVDMYLYMISWVPSRPFSTVCCWNVCTKSANTRRILIFVRKLLLEMCLAKDLGMQSKKLKEKGGR